MTAQWIANSSPMILPAEILAELAHYAQTNLAYDWSRVPEMQPVETAHNDFLAFMQEKVLGIAGRHGVVSMSGTQSNQLALRLAAHNRGVCRILCSDLSHSSVLEAVQDKNLKITSLPATEQQSARGIKYPAVSPSAIMQALSDHPDIGMVVMTAGTTKFGTPEDMILTNQVLDELRKKNIWLHVDAAWGAHNLILDQQRDCDASRSFNAVHDPAMQRVRTAMNAAQSVCIDAHKLFGMFGLSTLYVQEKQMEIYLGRAQSHQDYFPSSRKLAGTTMGAMPLMVADAIIKRQGLQAMQDAVNSCQMVAGYTRHLLASNGFASLPTQSATLAINVTGDPVDYFTPLAANGIRPSRYEYAGRDYLWLPVTPGMLDQEEGAELPLILVETMVAARQGLAR